MRYKIVALLMVILIVFSLTASCNLRKNEKVQNPTDYYEYTVKRGILFESVDISGQVVSDEECKVKSLVSGVVERVFVEKGDRVKEGDILVELDDDDYLLNRIKALQNYENARISGSKLLLEQRKLELQIAEKNLERTKIKSPIDGVVVSVDVREGDILNVGKVVATVINDKKLHIEGAVDEIDFGKITIGQKAIVHFESLGGLEVPAVVTYISPIAITSGGLNVFPIELGFETDVENKRIVPGLSCDVSIVIISKKGVLTVPTNALGHTPNGYYVELKTEDGVKKQPVEVGYIGEYYAEIKDGLKEGDVIVIGKKTEVLKNKLPKITPRFLGAPRR